MKFIFSLVFVLFLIFYQNVSAGEIVIKVKEKDGSEKTVTHTYEDLPETDAAKNKVDDSGADNKYDEVINQFKKNEKAMNDIEKQLKEDLDRMQGGG